MSSPPPSVSVIVLTYNSARFVRRCLDSLVCQTVGDFEVIVVDAGSTDETKTMVKAYDSRFRWLELPQSDMGAARNFGLKHSRGRYLAFLDSDDYYLPRKLERDVAAFENAPMAEVIFCDAWHFRTQRPDRMGLKKDRSKVWTLADFLAGHNRNLNTMSLRRSVWEQGFAFGEGDRGRYGEEWRFQLALALAGLPMVFLPEALVVVEVRPDSHTLWSRQWIMKSQAVAELEAAAAKLTPERRRELNVEYSIDVMRWKMLVALLLDGQWESGEAVVAAIHDPAIAKRSRLVWVLLRILPGSWVRRGLRWGWTMRQDHSFDWRPASSVA